MPVPVDGTRPMAVSKPKLKDVHLQQEYPLPESLQAPGKGRKFKKRKGKETEEVTETTDEGPWSWKSLTDSSASKVRPVFTEDGSYFFAATGLSVKIYSSATGQVVSTLDPSGSSDTGAAGNFASSHSVSTLTLNPHNPFQLITGSTDGFIRIWDFLDAVLLQTLHVGYPITHIAAHEKFKDYLFLAVARPSKKKSGTAATSPTDDNAAVLRVSLKPTNSTAGMRVQRSSDVNTIGKTRATSGLALSPNGAWLVATGGHKAYVASTSDLKAGFTKFVSPQHLTCMAFHPSEDYFATGDVIGCIRLWYCLGTNLPKAVGVEKTAQTTTMHWHAHAVSSIAFTTNGAYLLSGGEEAVLVIWQLHSGKKEYVPRVGAPIMHVVLGKARDQEEEYLLGLADSSFVFVRSGTLRITRSIARVKLDPAISHDRPSTSSAIPLAVHPSTSTLILPSSHPSTLQVYSPSSSKLVSEIEVSPSNRISRKDERPLEPSRVEHAVVCDSGEWMATVDRREADESVHGEVYMKFWWWDHKQQHWILNTRIDRPHGLQKVTAVAFRPGSWTKDDLLLATAGEDGNIKTWRIRSVKRKSGEDEDFWVARSTTRFRSETPTHISWSTDGSLLAVAMGSHVALYDGSTNTLYDVLTSPDCKQVSSAHFIGSSGRYVVVAGPRDLMLWDLVRRSMRWHYHSSSIIERVVTHSREETFAVFEQLPLADTKSPSTTVLLFNPSSAVPFASRTLPFRLKCAISHSSLDVLSTDSSSFTLVGITQTWSVVVFGDELRLPQEEGSTAQGIDRQGGPGRRTLFQDIFGKSAFADLTVQDAASTSATQPTPLWRGKEIAEVFDPPAYLMPPLGSLFDSLLDRFLTARPSEDASDDLDEQEGPDEDVDMEEQDDSGPLTLETRIDRVVDKHEMETFVELFKHHAIKASAPAPSNQQPNGVHKPNGVRKPRTKAVNHTTPVASAKVNGIKQNAQANTSPASPAPMTGKKRKKSLG